ncbi:hypothetical protein [Melittangium boletus]|uniref:hypothetical protein n=1 Tax=Melittangium boletus TaxID=83453 RepID=UPI003DA64001
MRTPSALGPLLVSAVLLVLAGAARGEAPPPGPTATLEGHWLRPFARGTRLAPCAHGLHAWVWTPQRAGLALVDADGREVASVGLGGQNPWDEDVWVVDVLPSADPERAWVHVQERSLLVGKVVSSVYAVDHQGTLTRLPLSFHDLMLAPSEGRERLWIVPTLDVRALWVFDAAGGVKEVPLGASGQALATVGQVLPVGNGEQGWLVLDQSLYQVDLRARVPFNPKPLRARDVKEVLPTSTPGVAWVFTRALGSSGTQLVRVGGAGPVRAKAPGAAEVQRLYPQPEGQRFWLARPSAPGAAASASLLLADAEGQEVGPGVEVHGRYALEYAPDGEAWLSDERRVVRLGDAGSVVAWSAEALGGARLVPVSGERAWAVSRTGTVSLLGVSGATITVLASRDTGLSGPRLQARDDREGWVLSDEGTRLHRLTRGLEGLVLTPVLEGVSLGEVLPIPGTARFWLAGTPRGHVYGPASEVRRVEVGFSGGGRLTRSADGQVAVTGRLEAGAPLESLVLDWPGLAQAEAAGRSLQLDLSTAEGERVGQGVRRFGDFEGLLFQWSMPPGGAEQYYRAVVSHEVENGTRLAVTFQDVPFGLPLLERMWFRTLLVCLGLTLLLVVPLVLLRPTGVSRRWLPLVAYTVSLVGLGGGELWGWLGGLRVHLPTVVAVMGLDVVLCAGLGLLSPAIFRRLVYTHPFSWAAAPLLRWPAFRRRFFAGHVRQVLRRVEVASAQANGEVFVDLSAHVVDHAAPGLPPSASERSARDLALLLTQERAHLLIQCAGGRGKSALLRQLVRLSLARFVDKPGSPLPVFIDPAAEDLEAAAKDALRELGLPEGLRDALLESGDFFLVLDGLTESRVSPEALRRYLEREVGLHAPLLLSARPNEAFHAAMSHALRWLAVEPKRLDEAGLARFQEAYPGPDGKPSALSEPLRRICRGRAADGTYVPLLARLALRFGGEGVDSVINLYRAVFAGLLKTAPDDPATSEMLAFAEALCLGSYWAHRHRLLVFRDSPDEAKLRRLLDAGLLVPADARPGPVPTHVRFFHDSMQSYLTARALFARHAAEAHWDCLWRAAGEPGFAREQSDLMTEAGSELFQMCTYVFGHDARLKAELTRHLELCAEANDERLTKEGILAALPESLRSAARRSGRALGPGALLAEVTRVCVAHPEHDALFLLYARIAPLAWPWRPDEADAAAPRKDVA